MADENIVTNIVAKSDFSNLIADLNKVSSALVKLQDELQASNKNLAVQADAINRNFASTIRSTGQFSTHFVSLSSDVDKFGMQLEKGQIKLRQFFRVYSEHSKTTGGLIRDLAKQQVQLQNAILQPLGRNAEGLMQYNVHIPRGLDLIKNKSAVAKQELQIMNRVIQEGANQLINWGKNTQWAGRQLTVGLTVPMAAFGKAAADAFKTADEQLVRLTKVYGGIAATSSSDLLKIRKDVAATAKELSKSLGSSFNETLGLAADIAATGKTGNELLGSVRETTRLSVLGEVDRQEAMKATLAIQTAFNQNTSELSDTINFLNAVENQTSTSLADLIEAIPKAGPVVKGLGGDVKDLALYLTAMREGGINAAEGANALKSTLASLINPTKVATDMFASLGIDLKGIVAKNAGDLTGTILQLQAALDKLAPLQRQQAIEQLFGKFQFARINALFENLGKQGSQTLQVLDLMKASSSELAGIAGRELSQVTESASGKYRRAIEGLKADLAGIGDQFLTINTHLINFIDGIVKFVNKLPAPIKSVLSFFGMLTAAAGPLIMLTGVLGNFFGYVIKGASHFRSLFKGGEGWKLLTPEIMAAQKAGNLIEKTFYSDAQAATILKTAIQNLATEYETLAAASQKAAVPTNPTVTTTGGTMIIPGRVVNPNNPYAGEYGSRAATHMNPVSKMTQQEKMAQTIFGVVPGPIPVNQRIGANPQIMTMGDLPVIPGLTQINKVSTGVVASEAAKWHSMTGMLSMLSKREVKALRKEIVLTGTMSQEFIQTYATLHPVISKVTQNAAKESQLILSQLQAGKLTVDQARAQIVAINAQMEAMMVQSTQQVAQSLGRTVNLTTLPMTNQPVVNAGGKSNVKEMFKPGRSITGVIDKIARILGVRTYGAGYSTETTIPKKFQSGGELKGTIVDGPRSDRTDTQIGTARVGDFVLNRDASDALLGYQDGGEIMNVALTPGEIVFHNPTKEQLNALNKFNDAYHEGGPVHSNPHGRVRAHVTPSKLTTAAQANLKFGTNTPQSFQDFASQYPEHSMLVKDDTTILLTANENSKLRPEGGGLTKPEAISMISSSSAKELFGDYPDLTTQQKELMKTQLVTEISKHSNSKRFFDSDLSQAFKRARRSVASLLPADQKRAFNNVWQSRTIARKLSYGSFDSLAEGRQRISGGANLSTPQARIAAGQITSPQFFTGPQGSGKINVLIPRTGGGSHGIASGSTINLKKPWWESAVRSRPILRNSGGTIGMNSRGRITGYNRGGRIRGYQFGGGIIGNIASTGAGFAASSLLGNLGQKVAGDFGGMAGQVLGFPIGMSLASSFLNIGKSAEEGAKGVGKFGGILTNVFSKANIYIAIAVALTTAFLKLKQRFTEFGEANRLMMGGTKESLASVGINNYKSITDRLKEAQDARELEKVRTAQYLSSGKGGPSQVSLTVSQLKDAVKNAQENQKDYVNMFNKINQNQVTGAAANLKAQFVAMGMSAQDAANQVYAIVKASNKAGQSLQAVASTNFGKITDQATALEHLFNNLAKSNALNKGNAEEFARGLDTLFNALMAQRDKLMEPDKKTGQIKTEAEATKQVMEQINKIKTSGSQLSAKEVENLKSQNIVYQAILGNAETLSSIMAKLMMYQSGIGDIVNLQKMSGAEAVSFASTLETVQQGIDVTFNDTDSGKALTSAITSINSTLSKQTNLVKNLSTLNTAAVEKRLKEIDKEIKKNNELADAKIKALQQESELSDFNLQIQKRQLEYQDALARGDMSAAAQAQLDIGNLQKQKSIKDAIAAVDEKRKADNAKLEAERQAIQDKKDAQAQALTDAQNNLAKTQSKQQDLVNLKQQVETLLLRYQAASAQANAGDQQGTKNQIDIRNSLAGLLSTSVKSKDQNIKAFAEGVVAEMFPGGLPKETQNIYGGPDKFTAAAQKYLDTQKTSLQANTTFASAVAEFKSAVLKFKGSTTEGAGTKDNPFIIRDTGLKDRYGKDIAPSKEGYIYLTPEFVNSRGFKSGQYFTYGENKYYLQNDNVAKLQKQNKGGQIKHYANGGYVGKLHTLNGPVPGPYGKEVSAILKAGTEGVYQNDYINSLKSSPVRSNSIIINNEINAADGMDINMLADIVTRKTVGTIQTLNHQERLRSGTGKSTYIRSA